MIITLNTKVTNLQTNELVYTEVDVVLTNKQYKQHINEETLNFFRGLGGKEVITRLHDGSIKLESTNPEKDVRATRIFTFSH